MNWPNKSNKTTIELDPLLQEIEFIQQPPTTLSDQELKKIRTLAWRIIEGYIDSDEINKLSESSLAQLSKIVQQILLLRDSPTLIEIEEANPYYEVFPSKIIRDN